MNTKIKPLSDRVLVEHIENAEETRSGIILPKGSEDKETKLGTVIAVGPGRVTDQGVTIKPTVEVGQKVVFSWGEKIEYDRKEYFVIHEGSLLAVIEN